MYSYENPEEEVSLLRMNSELQYAQLELQSAHGATHQLRLHYSTDDLARYGRRDVLRKSAEAASALNEFYSAVERKMPQVENNAAPLEFSPHQVAEAVEWLSAYLQGQREHYATVARPLKQAYKAMMWPYFSSELLERILVVELHGARVAVPDFFDQVRAMGLEPPAIRHMDSLTFLDVVVFNQQLTERALFHALVHAVQIHVLGLPRYAELWVQSFIKTRVHFTVPLEVHAFSLASKFLRPAAESFSVEDSVLRWIADDRY
jgi:hypothetical protein